MNNDYDDMDCCSAYFYTRYADESTLIDLSMINYPYTEKDENCLLSEDDQSLLSRSFAFTKHYSSWFRVLFFIIFIIIYSFLIIYFYDYFYIRPQFSQLNLVKSSC